MNIRRNFVMACALGAILLALSAVAVAQTESPHSQFSLYGMHFVSAGQTLRVTVQNPRVSDSEITPCIRVRIVFDIYEGSQPDNGRLRFSRRVSREVELDVGEAASFDFPAGRTGEWISAMVFARPEESNPPESGRARLLSTLVVREGGRTILNLPAVLKGFDPQPDPPR